MRADHNILASRSLISLSRCPHAGGGDRAPVGVDPAGARLERKATMTILAAPMSPSVSPDDLLRRLVQAKGSEIADIVSVLPSHERARVAFFCYARGHLHERIEIVASIGLDQLGPASLTGVLFLEIAQEQL